MKAFSVDKSKLNKLKYQSVPKWDSVGHMGMIAKLEEAFNITFERTLAGRAMSILFAAHCKGTGNGSEGVVVFFHGHVLSLCCGEYLVSINDFRHSMNAVQFRKC